MSGKPLITFIIPTIGRSTLSNTLESLINQTNPNWKAIVIFDGVSSTIKNTDRRISVIESSKLGKTYNSAGVVRNYGITLADTEWVAFVVFVYCYYMSNKYCNTCYNNKYQPNSIWWKYHLMFHLFNFIY